MSRYLSTTGSLHFDDSDISDVVFVRLSWCGGLATGAMSDDAQDQVRTPDSKDQQQQSKALDSLSDHVEERQLDSTRVQQAMASINARAEADRHAQQLKEKELSAVKINQEDLDIMVEELELDRKVAEKRLREHKGNRIAAIQSFLND
ncbi:hypothetical protein R1flu_012012 [Riccia fluitans]|uniref:Nascent polypeptide-associated complex subunit alpha-like UBA domain-containing protein n=1 Tax=Riccia fluitans TaxID=41844 RepID=A0ABD1Z9L7_9MARC